MEDAGRLPRFDRVVVSASVLERCRTEGREYQLRVGDRAGLVASPCGVDMAGLAQEAE